jgi:hypothetical protein
VCKICSVVPPLCRLSQNYQITLRKMRFSQAATQSRRAISPPSQPRTSIPSRNSLRAADTHPACTNCAMAVRCTVSGKPLFLLVEQSNKRTACSRNQKLVYRAVGRSWFLAAVWCLHRTITHAPPRLRVQYQRPSLMLRSGTDLEDAKPSEHFL